MTGIVERFDLLVVGGGKAGKTLAMDTARSGKSVVMVERDMIGGSCINVACIPTKALVSSARTLRSLRHAGQVGVEVEAPRVTSESLLEHKVGVVEGMVAINHKQFLDSGMDLVLGQAHFVAPGTVEVALSGGGTRTLSGAQTVINTGTRPFIPPIPGLSEAGYLTSDSLLDLERLPQHLVIIGGGAIGLEFAQMFVTFGTQVTLVEAGNRLLPREDEDIARSVTELLTRDGIRIVTGVSVSEIRRNHGNVHVTLSEGSSLEGDALLVATGRAPVTSDLNLSAAGVDVDDKGYVATDERLATSAPGIWAAGDVAGSPQFTHVSLDDYRILKENLAGGSRSTKDRLIPYTIFLTPELARVGLTEEQARAAGHDVRIAKLPVAAIPRARTMRETDGLWKAVIDRRTDRILGVSLLGPEAGETLTTVQTAILADMPYTALRDMIITHPTMTEGLNLLFAAVKD
ncbi:FAD-dependent oxidoreductase [Streptomyces sp. NBC_01571]|uniref:dihydrolipoyl dehydrogenase family protein n=1 Tax=Streptomyces sp. NBC_01571 TaxID=2975883 RepID=UPI00225863C7|nr:FAD-dependent oxidoreductase [Streptomyces sp. NBC_01571]MCX4580592.1 FAD-dependent oxidoreductase [Streptomyces sp. NBC_01571]